MNLCHTLCHTGLLAVLVLPALTAHAMEALDDQQMATSTGQVGLTIGLKLPNSTIAFSQLGLVNIDNRSNPTSPRASLVIAPSDYSATQGIRFFSDPTLNTLITQQMIVKVAADRNGGNPVLNLNIGLPSDLQRIRLNPFSVYMADGSGNIFTSRTTNGVGTNTLRAGVAEVLRSPGAIDVRFKAGAPITLNLQLAAEPQSHMLQFNSGALTQIVSTAPIELRSSNTGPSTSSLRFNLNLTATDSVAGFGLAGFYADISANGLIIGKDGWTDKLNLQVTDIIAGDVPASNVNVFNGLPNASMGSIGLEGLRMNNLRVSVAGM